MREAFAVQKLLNFFLTKNIGLFEVLTFEILTKRSLTMLLVLNNLALVVIFQDLGQCHGLLIQRSTLPGQEVQETH